MRLVEGRGINVAIVDPNEMKRLIPVLIRSENTIEVIRVMRRHDIKVPRGSVDELRAIDYYYNLVKVAVETQHNTNDRENFLDSIPDLVPPLWINTISQLAIWSFNMQDQMSMDGNNALDRIFRNPETLSDQPLWRLRGIES